MKYDVIIIGGGIVGLATALKLTEKMPALRIAILEKENDIALHQTGHNSGVIHSGIYYKPGSLKAINCINGYKELIRFCDLHGIAYELCGKIIVATQQSELAALENVYRRGIDNKLEGIRKISRDEIREMEPHASGISGIAVPQTGIISYTGVAQTYARLFKQAGGHIFTGEKVTDIRNREGQGSEVVTLNKTYEATLLINCAGLFSDKIAAINSKELNVRIIPFRGEYYKIREDRKFLVRNLIYPVPDPNFPFLGVHYTRMIDGAIEAGPNAVFAFRREGYKRTDFKLDELMESIRWPGFRKVAAKYWETGLGEFYRSFFKGAFTKALQKLIPEIKNEDLIPAGAGVRAQACDRTGGLIDDFLILEDAYIVNVLNAPSPAATSSLSIGTTIAAMAEKRF
jgi:L-2-hydroxyglutarate oxidase